MSKYHGTKNPKVKVLPATVEQKATPEFKALRKLAYAAIPETGDVTMRELKSRILHDLQDALDALRSDRLIRFDQRVVKITRFSRGSETKPTEMSGFNRVRGREDYQYGKGRR